MLDLFNQAVPVATAILAIFYLVRYRGGDPLVFNPAAAWTRAFIYFFACFYVSWLTGTQAMILETPLWTDEQLSNTSWWLWTGGLTAFILFAYWGIWMRFTIRFDRKLHLITQIPFGLVWGLAMGQVVLIFWKLALDIGDGWALWQVGLLAWFGLGIWQWLWQDFGWDVYISPEHDSPYSIPLKTAASHIPNVTFCLIYIGMYENYAILIALQTLALVAASIGMRMPPPWSREVTPPARRVHVFGPFYRAGGYVSKDPENDHYLKAAHLPK